MSLLSIVQDIADEVSGPRPATIASNTNPDAQNYLRIVNKVGKRLMKLYDWQDLRAEHSFTAGGAETLVSLANMPSDFDRFIPETFWDRGGKNLISGPISPTEWNGLKVQNYDLDNYKFIYRGGAVLTSPVISSGNECAFEYVSKNYVLASDAVTYKARFTADDDTGVIDEELITLAATYVWLDNEGQPAGSAFQAFKDYFDVLQRNEAAVMNVAVTADIFGRNSRHFEGAPQSNNYVSGNF